MIYALFWCALAATGMCQMVPEQIFSGPTAEADCHNMKTFLEKQPAYVGQGRYECMKRPTWSSE